MTKMTTIAVKGGQFTQDAACLVKRDGLYVQIFGTYTPDSGVECNAILHIVLKRDGGIWDRCGWEGYTVTEDCLHNGLDEIPIWDRP